MNSENEELKSCPFCNGKAVLYGANITTGFGVYCTTEGCEAQIYDMYKIEGEQYSRMRSKEEAIKAWNTRSKQPQECKHEIDVLSGFYFCKKCGESPISKPELKSKPKQPTGKEVEELKSQLEASRRVINTIQTRLEAAESKQPTGKLDVEQIIKVMDDMDFHSGRNSKRELAEAIYSNLTILAHTNFDDIELSKELYMIVEKHLKHMRPKSTISLPIMIGEIMEVFAKFGSPAQGIKYEQTKNNNSTYLCIHGYSQGQGCTQCLRESINGK